MRTELNTNNLDLSLQFVTTGERVTEPVRSNFEVPSLEITHDWISAFNTSILTTRASNTKDRSEELTDLMQTPEFASLLVGAKHLSETQGLSKEEATERLIEAFRKIDRAWKQIVTKRGLQSLIE